MRISTENIRGHLAGDSCVAKPYSIASNTLFLPKKGKKIRFSDSEHFLQFLCVNNNMKTKNHTLDIAEPPFGEAAYSDINKPFPHPSTMKREFVNINNPEIPAGLEWFVFKKRSQRARKQKFRPNVTQS